MNSFNRRNKITFYIFLTFILCLTITFSTSLLRAQDTPTEEEQEKQEEETKNKVIKLDDVVVSATKTEIDPKETGASITVIEEEQLENRGDRSVIEALRSVPGLTVYRQGAPGGVSTLFIRGADAKNMLVLIDGVEVNDPSGIDRSFDFANLTTDNIERIEVIRGAQSTLYGSDATGGIINIITKKGKGKTTLSLKAEAGSYHTYKETVNIHGGKDDVYYSFSIGRIDSAGFSSAAEKPGTSKRMDNDKYQNITISNRAGYKIGDSTWISHVLRYIDANSEIDGGAYTDDPNYKQTSEQLSTAITVDQELMKWWESKFTLSYMDIYRYYNDKTDQYNPQEFSHTTWNGNHKKAEWRHILNILDIDQITAGLEIEENSAQSLNYHSYDSDSDFIHDSETTDVFDKSSTWNRAFYLNNHLKLYDRIFVITGFRYNDHQMFGDEITYSISNSIILPVTETRLKSNYSTGFKAPAITQLYETVYTPFTTLGNPDLKPEKSITWDIGLSQPLMGENIILDVTYFVAEYSDKIDLNDSWNQYINRKKVITKGVECSLNFAPITSLSFNASYTYLPIAKDEETNERLNRRPRHQGSFHANWKFLPGGNFNLGINYTGKRDDAWFDESTYSTVEEEMDAYYTLNIAASYWLFESVQVFGRVENMLDEDYEFPVGYNTPGRSYYAGLKAVL